MYVIDLWKLFNLQKKFIQHVREMGQRKATLTKLWSPSIHFPILLGNIFLYIINWTDKKNLIELYLEFWGCLIIVEVLTFF